MSIQDAGHSVATVEVKIGPQFLNLFSEHLYSSPNKAFEELVSNSWDAGAGRVYIHIPDELTAPGAAIWVLDDGGSMDVAGFQALWSVATSTKRIAEDKSHRKPIGKFGVGKLATYLLAHELTYVCKAADGIVRAITMDYRRIDEAEAGALHIEPLPLDVRTVAPAELKKLLENVPGRARLEELIAAGVPGPNKPVISENEFGGVDLPPPPVSGTWTLAVLSSLKPAGRNLSTAWVRRLLRTSLPLGNSITIFFNDEVLASTKSNAEVTNEWILGPGLELEKLAIGDSEEVSVTEHSSPYPHIVVDGLGEVTGRVRLYESRISGGKSDAVDLSNGFFVNIRGRVLKPEDPYFGLENLSHSAWSRFRATIRADGLDGKLSVNREAVADGRDRRILRALLMKLFNKARNNFDSATAQSWPDAGSVLVEKWGSLPFEPLRRVVEDVLASSFERPDFVVAPADLDATDIRKSWDQSVSASPGEMITDVVVEEFGRENKLSHYDVKTRRVIVNKSHPFAEEHQETSQQLRVLRDTAIVELLTDAFMVDIGISGDQTAEIRDYRDRALRLVAQVRRRSAAQIAKMLLASTSHAKGFERIIGDALEFIGFSVERLGQSGEPEGIATAVVTRGLDDAKVAYSFNYDAKSTGNGKVQTHNVGVAGLARHRQDHKAQHTMVIAPAFQEGALVKECAANKVTPMLAADLAKLVMMTVGFGPINLVQFRAVFEQHDPAKVTVWVDELLEAQKNLRHLPLGLLVQALTALNAKNADRPDMMNTALIAEQCRELNGSSDFPTRIDVANALRGISLMAPNVLSLSGHDVMLSAPPSKLLEMIAGQINAVPDEYRYGIARGVD